jgi:hypothetical protein
MYHLQFSFQAASPGTFGYTLVHFRVHITSDTALKRNLTKICASKVPNGERKRNAREEYIKRPDVRNSAFSIKRIKSGLKVEFICEVHEPFRSNTVNVSQVLNPSRLWLVVGVPRSSLIHLSGPEMVTLKTGHEHLSQFVVHVHFTVMCLHKPESKIYKCHVLHCINHTEFESPETFYRT